MTRWIELDGVVNMRDLGGLPTRDGRTTREGRLIRSDNLQDLSEGDVRHLVEVLGVTDVVDLRSHVEHEVTGLEDVGELAHGLAGDVPGRDHDPQRAGRRQRLRERLQRGHVGDLGAGVVADHLMAGVADPLAHVRAHLAQTDQTQLHVRGTLPCGDDGSISRAGAPA